VILIDLHTNLPSWKVELHERSKLCYLCTFNVWGNGMMRERAKTT